MRRRLSLLPIALASLLAGLLTGLPAGPAGAANPVTPGSFTGYGFDQCLAPTQRSMDTWLKHSPFLAVGIYIAGDSRGCRSQPNLDKDWVRRQLARGWRLLPITLGPQASCSTSFPRYGNDETIKPRPGRNGRYGRARAQGRAQADASVAAAVALGIPKRSTLWYDLEGFNSTLKDCRESALAFLSATTKRLHELGWVSGVYSSAGSGIKMLDDARVNRPKAFNLPDRIWIARWDGRANTSTSYIRDGGWRPGGRVKQYQGGHNETWGGVTINIDRNYLELIDPRAAPPVEHCDGVDVDHPSYGPLEPGVDAPALVLSLKCLLSERDAFTGRMTGVFGQRLLTATKAWQTEHGFKAGERWTRAHWMTLTAAGPRPVLKFGSTGEDVRRLQRTLDAASTVGLKITGVFNLPTGQALRAYQKARGQAVTGIVVDRTWRALKQGLR